MPEIKENIQKSSEMFITQGITELRSDFFDPENKEKERNKNEDYLEDINEF